MHKTLKEIRKLVSVISVSSPCKETTLKPDITKLVTEHGNQVHHLSLSALDLWLWTLKEPISITVLFLSESH